MGIFKFLKKSPAADDLNALQIKGTAYDNTPQALPPIQGTLPFQGNGPNTLDELQRSARIRRDGPMPSSSSTSGDNHSPAPSNRIARLRSMSVGRPSTAPGNGGGVTGTGTDAEERPKSSSGRTPRDPSKAATPTKPAPSSVATGPKKKHGPPYLIGVVSPRDPDSNNKSDKDPKALNDEDEDGEFRELEALPPVPSIAEHFKQVPPPSPSLASVRTVPRSERTTTATISSRRANGGSISGSIISTGGSMSTTTTATARGGHVDLLDAQGAFKPSDFRSRVRAAGVRDYGEDVADRNMGVNGVDLGSAAVKAFYALAGGQALVYRSDGSARDVHGHTYTPGNIPLHLRSRDDDEDGNGGDTARTDQDARVPRFPARTTSLEPREEIIRTSTPGYTTRTAEERAAAYDGGRFDNAAAAAAAQRRRMSVHGSALTSSTPQRQARQTRPVSMHPILSDFQPDEEDEEDVEAASVPDIPRRRPPPNDFSGIGSGPWDATHTPRSQSRARDSVLVTKKQQRDGSGKHRSNSTKRARTKGKAKQQQQQHRDIYSEESEVAERPRSRSSAAARRRRQGKARVEEAGLASYTLGSNDTIPSLPSHAIGQTNSSRPSSSSSQTRARTRSIGASSARGRSTTVNQLHDITEYIPNRRSSLSISSIPSSSLSSNPFPSSQSRHTADTSVDLCYTSSNTPQKPDVTPGSDRKGYVHSGKPRSATLTSNGSSRPGGYEDQRADPPALYLGRGAMSATTAGSSDTQDDEADMTTTTDGSDIDSFVEKRRHRRTKHADGEGLLFREGAYGATGGGLPGLFSFNDGGRHGHGEEDDDDCDSMIASDAAPAWPSSLRHPYSSKRRAASSSRPRSAVPSVLSSHKPPPIPSWDSSLPVHGKTSSKYHHYHPNAGHDDDDDDDTSTVSESEAGRTSRAGSSVYPDDDDDVDDDDNKDEGIRVAPVMTGAYDQIDVRLAMRLRREMERRGRAVRSTSAVRPKSMAAAWDGYERKRIRANAEV